MTETVGVVVSKSDGVLSNIFSNIESSLLINIFIGFVIFVRILAIIGVAKDIMSRTNKLSFQLLSLFLITFGGPVVGLLIYFVIRPIGHKHDKLPRRESVVMNLVVCYNCSTLNPKDHNCCMACGEALKIKCKQCGKKFPHSYGYCSNCGAPNIE